MSFQTLGQTTINILGQIIRQTFRLVWFILKTLLTPLLYKLGLGKSDVSDERKPAPRHDWWDTPKPGNTETATDALTFELEGTTGFLDVPTLLLVENNQVVLIVDHEFKDIPSWVEWDRTWQKLSIVQMGGALAELALGPEILREAEIDKVRRLLLVTGPTENRLSHFVSIIIRD